MIKKTLFLSLLFLIPIKICAESSSQIRAKKHVSLNFHTGNVGGFYAEIGPSAEYFFNSWFSAGISYRYIFKNPIIISSIGNDSGNDLVTKMNRGSNHYISLDAKLYLGDPFYFKTGLGYNMMTFKKDTGSSFQSSALMLPLALGTTWQWENFNLSVEWIGTRIPLATFESYDQESLDDLKNERKHPYFALLHMWKGVTVLTFSFGIAL